jgi:hypothetical protein
MNKFSGRNTWQYMPIFMDFGSIFCCFIVLSCILLYSMPVPNPYGGGQMRTQLLHLVCMLGVVASEVKKKAV